MIVYGFLIDHSRLELLFGGRGYSEINNSKKTDRLRIPKGSRQTSWLHISAAEKLPTSSKSNCWLEEDSISLSPDLKFHAEHLGLNENLVKQPSSPRLRVAQWTEHPTDDMEVVGSIRIPTGNSDIFLVVLHLPHPLLFIK